VHHGRRNIRRGQKRTRLHVENTGRLPYNCDIIAIGP
jgi:hypothetical protein